jgi:serine/threonine protein phosphatase 1
LPEALYAVGDIHGMKLHLDIMLDKIFRDFKENNYSSGKLVFLGDYVDRGPDSKGVLDTLMNLEAPENMKVVNLKGNHEIMMHDNLDFWNHNGGAETLKSFNAKSIYDIPEEYLTYIKFLPLYHIDGEFMFVHAGIYPEKHILSQTEEDLVWIRKEFLNYNYPHFKFIFHGHTPTMGVVDLKSNRCNVDSGSNYSGNLSSVKYDRKTKNFTTITVDTKELSGYYSEEFQDPRPLKFREMYDNYRKYHTG